MWQSSDKKPVAGRAFWPPKIWHEIINKISNVWSWSEVGDHGCFSCWIFALTANHRIADGSSLRRVGHCLCFLPDWVREREFHSPGILLLQEKCKEINHLLSIKVEQACKWRTRFQTNKTLISRFQMKGHCQQIYRTRNSQSSGKWTDDLICYYHQPPTPSNKN